MSSLRIAIAGCGPAGLSCALFLHRAGHRVTLFDQFATPAPLGSGLILQPTGLHVLDRLGVGARMRRHGARIDRLYGRALPSRRVVLDVRYATLGADVAGLAVHRAALFEVLFDAVTDEKIDIETSCAIRAFEIGADGAARLIDAKGRARGPFDLVVDALGARSPLSAFERTSAGARALPFGALWATLPWPAAPFDPHALEQRYEKANVMIGVLPLGAPPKIEQNQTAFFWSLKPVDHAAWRASVLDAWKARARALWPETAPLLDAIRDSEQLTLAQYAHATLPYPAGARIVRVGDAAHMASPQLGQGANMALIDALALSHALAGDGALADRLDAYVRLRGLHVRLYQAISAVFTPFYQSDGALLPWMRDRIMAPLSRAPLAPRLLASLVCGDLIDPFRSIPKDGAPDRG